MPILSFNATEVAAAVAQARNATSFLSKWDGPVQTPGLVLVIDQGIFMMSNAAVQPAMVTADQPAAKSRVYAKGFDPLTATDWHDRRTKHFRDFSGLYHLDLLADVDAILRQPSDVLQLSLKDHLVSIYDPAQIIIEVGETYKTPSGLGGVFQVKVLELDAHRALVQNTGNCEDFDDMGPYRVPRDQLQLITNKRAA